YATIGMLAPFVAAVKRTESGSLNFPGTIMAPITALSPHRPHLPGRDGAVRLAGVSNESGEELLPGPGIRFRRWHYITVGFVLVVAACVQVVARHGLVEVVRGTGQA